MINIDSLTTTSREDLCSDVDNCPLAELEISAEVYCPLLGRPCPLARMLAKAAQIDAPATQDNE